MIVSVLLIATILCLNTTPASSSPVPQPQPQPLFLDKIAQLFMAKLGLKRAIAGAIAR